MSDKLPVPIYGRPTGFILVEDGATAGATIGTDLLYADGSVVPLAAIDVTAHLAEADPHTQYVNITSTQTVAGAKTFTDDIRIMRGANSGGLKISSEVGQYADVMLEVDGVSRWSMRATNSVESGGDTGTYYQLKAFGDDGLLNHNVFQVKRDDGIVDFKFTPTVAGVPLTASAWTTVAKTATQSRTSTTVLADDSQLKFSCAAGKSYKVRAHLILKAEASGTGCKSGFDYTGTTSGDIVHHRRFTNPGSAASFDTEWAGVVIVPMGSVATGSTTLAGYAVHESQFIFTATTAGTLSVIWAQSTSNANALSMVRGSYLEYMEV